MQPPPGGLGPATAPSTTSSPPRDFSPDAPPTTYGHDPDVLSIDPAFDRLVLGNASIQRLWHGPINGKPILWAEGPAWNAQGRYLLWSDIPNNRQLRWLEEDGHVSVFREATNNSNGNTFDFGGRQISCEHLTRRVIRHELDDSITIIADNYEGKPLNSPNDVVPHPDGSIWFTDPPYGAQLYEGTADRSGGPTNPGGKINAAIGQPAGYPMFKRELPTNCYRWDPDGRLSIVVTEDQVHDPNGILFSPDYKTLYVVSTGKGPGDTVGGDGNVYQFDVAVDGKSVSNQRLFTDCMVDGIKCRPDGMRCDVFGNVWVSSAAGRNLGYSGVTCWDPSGKLLGRIRLPESVGNLAFGGPKRNRIFMAASTSLYALYVAVQGAAPG